MDRIRAIDLLIIASRCDKCEKCPLVSEDCDELITEAANFMEEQQRIDKIKKELEDRE